MIMYVNSEDGIYTAYPWLITQRYTGKPETECEDLFIKSLVSRAAKRAVRQPSVQVNAGIIRFLTPLTRVSLCSASLFIHIASPLRSF